MKSRGMVAPTTTLPSVPLSVMCGYFTNKIEGEVLLRCRLERVTSLMENLLLICGEAKSVGSRQKKRIPKPQLFHTALHQAGRQGSECVCGSQGVNHITTSNLT
jgi:hypothetical protein